VLYDAADDLSREAIAAVMSRIRLNATATPTPLRPPLLNAKRWATLDLISRGRLTITDAKNASRRAIRSPGAVTLARDLK
jgi:alkanesulfonate monooxygenase SsuD/methylene tetrahydromethanopterin reductase-like flavin-dependent oxidoreductase (luciferase family)